MTDNVKFYVFEKAAGRMEEEVRADGKEDGFK